MIEKIEISKCCNAPVKDESFGPCGMELVCTKCGAIVTWNTHKAIRVGPKINSTTPRSDDFESLLETGIIPKDAWKYFAHQLEREMAVAKDAAMRYKAAWQEQCRIGREWMEKSDRVEKQLAEMKNRISIEEPPQF